MRARCVLGVPVVAALSACSLLVQFHDEPAPCDGGCDASPDVADGGADARDGGSADAMDASVDVVHLCKGSYDGWYCGYNAGLNGRAASPDDLVHCLDGAAFIVDCDAGCVGFPSGVPDMCNTCGSKQGYYCADQLGSSAKDFYVFCSGGVMTPQKKCTTCVSGPGDAACL